MRTFILGIFLAIVGTACVPGVPVPPLPGIYGPADPMPQPTLPNDCIGIDPLTGIGTTRYSNERCNFEGYIMTDVLPACPINDETGLPMDPCTID